MLSSTASVVTHRESPLPAGASSAAGAFHVRSETVSIQTDRRVVLIDLTERVDALARRLSVHEGLLHLWPLHTTCAVFINEYQHALLHDIERFLERLAARDAGWMHNDPAHSDCDRMNADAHLRALLLGHGLSLQIAGGDVVLGRWQRILLAELDGPRLRTLRVQAMGIRA